MQQSPRLVSIYFQLPRVSCQTTTSCSRLCNSPCRRSAYSIRRSGYTVSYARAMHDFYKDMHTQTSFFALTQHARTRSCRHLRKMLRDRRQANMQLGSIDVVPFQPSHCVDSVQTQRSHQWSESIQREKRLVDRGIFPKMTGLQVETFVPHGFESEFRKGASGPA